MDSRASRWTSESRSFFHRYDGAAAQRRSTRSCIARPSAEQCGRKRATAVNEFLCVAGGIEHIDRRVRDFLKREARRDLAKAAQYYAEAYGVKVKRLRSAISPAAGVHARRRGLCPFPGGCSRARVRAGLSRRARSRASGRDEPFAAVLAGGRTGAPMSSAPRPGSTPMATTCIATGSRNKAFD